MTMQDIQARKGHIDRTVAALLASVLGGVGMHRFYVYGKKDFWAWAYVAAFLLYASLVLMHYPEKPLENIPYAFFPLSVYAAFIESLIIGLCADEKWDARHNRHSARTSESGWPVVATLVLTLLIGYTALVTSIARTTDLLYTGGSFG
ncbi:MAG: hypothetical protein ACO1NO_01245 [Burkholderiaceae bacterium]